jgi:hypothetical protein
MAYTGVDAVYIARVRSKIGDNPTREDGTLDVDKCVWSDDEVNEELRSARVTLFKGKRSSNSELSEPEAEMVVLGATINLIHVLAVNSGRYAQYTVREVKVERLSPSEWLHMAEALQTRLDRLIEDTDTTVEMGPMVHQSVILLHDKTQDKVVPGRFMKYPSAIPFTLTATATSVTVKIADVFIPTYFRHFLKKSANVYPESIVATWNVLTPLEWVDTDVVEGVTYTYTMCIEDLNLQLTSTSSTVVIPHAT